MTKSVIIEPVTGDEANHLLRQSDDYMASLYPAESNHLVDSSALRGGARALSVPFLMMFARVVLAFGFFKTARLMAKLNGFMLTPPIAARPLPAS